MLRSYDEFLAQMADLRPRQQFMMRDALLTTSSPFGMGHTGIWAGWSEVLPALPGTLDNYIVTAFSNVYKDVTSNSYSWMIFGRKIVLATIDIGDNSTTTPASMPTRKVLGGAGYATFSPMFIRAKTAITQTGNPTINITYTNQAGTSGQTTGSNTINACNEGTIGTTNLATGDRGARSVQSLARSGGTTYTGVFEIFGIDVLAILPAPNFNHQFTADFLLGAEFNPLRLPAGAELTLIHMVSQAAGKYAGVVTLIAEDT